MATADQFRAMMTAGNIIPQSGKQWAVERVPGLEGHRLRLVIYLASANGGTVEKNLPLLPANPDENLRVSFAGAPTAAASNTPMYVVVAGTSVGIFLKYP